MVSATITGTAKTASNDVAFAAGSVKSDKIGSFGSIMAKSLGSNAAAGNSASEKMSVVNMKKSSGLGADKSEVSKSGLNDGLSKTGSIDKSAENSENANSTTDSSKADKLDNSAGADEIQAEEELEAKAKEAAENVFDKIKDALGISDEELEKCMETLGLNMLELLDANNVIKLFMEAAGAEDAMQLVTDSDLSGALKDIMNYLSQITDELSSEYNLSSEEFGNMLAKMADSGSLEAAENVTLQTADETVDRTAETETEAAGTLEDAVVSKVTVERETGASGADSGSAKEQMNGEAQSGDSVNVGLGQTNVVQQISQTFEAAFANTQDVNAADVVRQVVDAIKLTNTRAVQSMEIQLNPENLGKVNILVSVREGVVTAQIAAQNEQVKRALEGQLITLKENFENQGIKVDAVEVTVQSNAFDGNAQFGDRQQQESAGKSRRRISLDDLKFDDDDEPEEEQSIIANANSSVEYMA